MPSWDIILADVKNEVKTNPNALDDTRKKYLKQLSEMTGRNVIAFYSGWLQHRDMPVGISDNDINGFMNAICGLDFNRGLDLILHTPGGDIAATESIVKYLRKVFDDDIRAIVPQLSMSGGTMIACACKEIVMGKQSSIGPIDPIVLGYSAFGILEEFNQAADDAKKSPHTVPLWSQIISKYPPTIIGECQKSTKWSEDIARNMLETGMFKNCDLKDQ